MPISPDHYFRSALDAILLPAFAIGIYYRLKSQATREKLDRRKEGWFILATLRPVGLSLWVGLIVWMLDPVKMAWSSVWLPRWLRWTGVLLVAGACGLLLWTFRSLGANLTDTVVTRIRHELVLGGPYRWVRNPFYDSALLLATGISLTTANWFFVAAGVAMFFLFVIRTRTEEANLIERFGESYRVYMRHTGRFFPGIGING